MNAAVLIAHAGQARKLVPGIIASGVIATAAMFLSQHYGAPVMLFALLLGIAMNFLSSESVCAPGIGFTGRTVLRCGVALLGLRITLGDISALGWQPAAVVVGSVAVTILVSIGAARLLGFRWRLRLLSGGAHGDLRRLRRARDLCSPAAQSAASARDHVHVINSFGLIPQPVVSAGATLSSWCLVAAIAALGVKTQLQALVTVGPKPVVLMVGETIPLAAIVLLALRFYG